MNKALKRVTLLSAAVLGFSGAAFVSTSTTANASTHSAKTTSVKKSAKKTTKKASAKKSTKKTTKKSTKKTAKKSTKKAATPAKAAVAATPAVSSSSSSSSVSSSSSSVAAVSSSTKSVGTSQTTVDSTYNVEGYSSATGGVQTSSVRWTIPLMNANVNWNNAVDNFNRDTDVMGNKNDVIPTDTLKASLKKDGFDTVYMKITPTVLPRLAGGIVDNLDSLTGLYMKFNLDQNALPTNPHYGDTLRLAYTVDDSALYRKGVTNSKYESNLNADGYVGLTIYRQWIKTILDLIVVNPLL